jgi:hypothetical protein
MLGLTHTRWAGVHVRRVHGETLLRVGAIVKVSRGKVLAHRVRFPLALFSLLIGMDPPSPLTMGTDPVGMAVAASAGPTGLSRE